ncbi:twin-arginine translocase TatA/TatE family subunit [Nocardioides sp. CFH 31398]|uniref:twin-arginine translocase TatA/TatE family subunit n=1 Tax=Nocardioides sp. CFH 31398 TaxID=2919579 RepID=UPI001F058261|nr:twin-arginine translocase TatA/TatE family subunit [Nocardioides sp. CFH 31398]MCH1868402.1 twin-arginine translocase TatA/TatE family subunit [Nocardioides sp. CFH 31398]
MLQNLTGWHALIILAIVLLVFGSAKLPALARGVGQSMRILKDEATTGAADDRMHDGEPRPRSVAS